MPVYTITDVKAQDWYRYREYLQKIRPIVEAHGGQYRVRGGKFIVKFGNWTPRRLVVIEFPSWDDLERFEASPEYGPVTQIRQSASTIVDVLFGHEARARHAFSPFFHQPRGL